MEVESLTMYKPWNELSISEKSEMMKAAIKNGITNLNDIKEKYNEFAEGGDLPPYSAGKIADALWSSPNQEYLGEPSHHYDFTQSEDWANAHGYYPDNRGHRDDRVKKSSHPSHPSKGNWSKDGNIFNLTDAGMRDPNYIFFGLADGDQDPQASLMYKDTTVLPEITVTPNGNYYLNPYDNYKLSFAEGGPEEKGEEEKKPQDKRDTEDNFIDKVIKKAAVLTRPGRYAADRVLHTADILGAPTHVTNALRDLNIFTANQPVILANALYNRLSGKSNSLANAYKEADTHPSKLASMFEVYPAVNTNKNYSEDELAAQYELRKNSSGKPGAITASGYKKLNDGRYAGDIDTASFFSPMKVNEWSLGQTSGKNINGENYTSDIFAYDLNDTKDQYIPRFFDSTGSGVMRLRALFGILGSKGYDDNTNSATAIRTLIPTSAQRSAYEKIKEEKLEEKSKNNKKATGGPLNEQSTENSGTATPLMTILEKKRSNMFVPVFENMDNSNKLPVTNDVKVEPEDPNIYKILSRDTDKYLIDAARKLEIENRENRNKSTIDYLKSLNKDEVKDIQRKIADSGFYDNELNIKDVNKIKAIQRNLVNKGYLHGEKEIDGIIGEKTKAAYTKYIRDKEVDGIVGKKTIAGYLNLNNQSQKEDTWNRDVSTQNIDGCAQWVTKKFEDAVGPLSKQNGVISNAWQMPQNVVDAGGKYIYNIYNDPVFSNIKDVADLKKKTAAALKNNPIDYSSIRVGDIVGIYMPSSNMHSTALKDGTTKNTHVGIVTGIDEDGIPIVEHNIHGIHKKDKANNLTGSLVGKPVIATVSRPKNSNEYIEPIFYENKESKFTIPKKYDNDEIKEFANSMAGAADQIKKIFPTVDIDAVQKIALAVQKRETNYMTNKVSDRGIVSKAFEGAKEFYKYNKHLLNPVLGTNFSKENEENKSSNLAKFKLSSLSQAERNFLNIHSKKDLENPTKAGLAALYYLSKNYDYFKRLQTAYPNLGITDADIEGLTILSYNQGMSKLSHIGFNEKTGKTAKEELESIRYLSDPDTKIKDITSTNWKHLGKLGKVYYDNFKGAFTPYIASAKKELSNITEGLPIQADENSLVAQNKNSKSFGGPLVQMANKFSGTEQPTQQMDRGNQPLYDGQIGFGFGYNPETFERYYTGFYNPYNNSYNNATWTDENDEYNIGLPTVTIRPSGESMVNRAQEKAAPVIRDVLLGSAALAGGIPALANAASKVPLAALKPGGAFWTNPLTRQMAAGTLAGTASDAASVAATGRPVGEVMSDVIHNYTGLNPDNNMFSRAAVDMMNPFYYTPYGVASKGVNTAVNVARIASPKYRALHAYNSVNPVGYDNIIKRGKDWLIDMVQDNYVDLKNPKFYRDLVSQANGVRPKFGYTGTGSYLGKNIKNAGQIADEARLDAWAIHNRLAPQYGTYRKNPDGSWSYDMDNIVRKSENTWYPEVAPKSTKKTGALDFVTGAGGGLTDFRLIGSDQHGNGLMHIEDLWDINPFKRVGDKLTARLFPNLNRKISDKAWSKALDLEVYGMENPDTWTGKVAAKLSPKLYKASAKPFLGLFSPIDNAMSKFEIGMVTGGKPFLMKTDIPFHKNPEFGIRFKEMMDDPSKMKFFDTPVYNYGYNPDYIVNLEKAEPILNFNAKDINWNKLRLTEPVNSVSIKHSK